MAVSEHALASPRARLEEARKQLGLALQDVNDDVVESDIVVALADTENALDKLGADPATYQTTGSELVECAGCGLVGLPERIHPTACPHDDDGDNGEDRDPSNDLDYLVGLAMEAREHDALESDYDQARYAVSQWCQELGYVPDLRHLETGKTVSPGDLPSRLKYDDYAAEVDE